MTETSEQTAEKIAARGREALIARLRPAFEEAAAAHADVLKLGPEQIESMVQRAAERADGLQWRRALASVATEDLGISLGEALAHPAVARAHELVGAPSYEASLAELGSGHAAVSTPEPAPAGDQDAAAPEQTAAEEQPGAEQAAGGEPEAAETTAPAEEVTPDAEDAPEDELHDEDEPHAEDEGETEAEAEPAADDEEHEEAEAEPNADAVPVAEDEDEDASDDEAEPAEEAAEEEEEPVEGEPEADAAPEGEHFDEGEYDDDYFDEDEVRVNVVHLGGIANLAPAEKNIELLMSEDGLDIIRGGGDVLGRLEWDQVKALEVPIARGRRRMRRPGPTHLVIRTARGDASFEVPEVSATELRKHLAPVIAEHLRRD